MVPLFSQNIWRASFSFLIFIVGLFWAAEGGCWVWGLENPVAPVWAESYADFTPAAGAAELLGGAEDGLGGGPVVELDDLCGAGAGGEDDF